MINDIFKNTRQRSLLILSYLAVSTPILAILYAMLPVSPANAIFDYMAWMRINGAHYYSDVAEQNWPGIIFIHELGIRIFGVHFWTYRFTDFIFLQFGCLGLFLFLKRCKFRFAPYFIVCLYPPLYITAGIWMAGQRDIAAIQLLFLVSGLLLVDSEKANFAKLQLFSAGIVMAEAVLIRPTYLAFLPVTILLQFILRGCKREPFYSVVFYILGFFGLLFTVLVWGISSQNLDDWFEQAIIFNITVYSIPVPLTDMLNTLFQWILHSWHWPSLFATIGFTLWIKDRGLRSESLYVAAIGCTILLSYFAQRKDLISHVSGLVTVAAVLITVLLDELLQRGRNGEKPFELASNGLFFLALAVIVVGVASKLRVYQPMVKQIAFGQITPVDDGTEHILSADVIKVAEYIRNHSSQNDYIFQWGRAFHVGFLAQRRSSSRFISTPALDIIPPNNNSMKFWLNEFSTDLNQKRPKFVVLTTDLVTIRDGQLWPMTPPSPAFQSLLHLLSVGYRKALVENSLILMQTD